MRAISSGIPWNTIYNPFNGDVGRALYVSPDGVTDPSEINYRNIRLLSLGPATVCNEFPAIGDGPLGLDAHVALAKTTDPLEWTLPAEYLDSSFVVNVRPHKAGLELDAISGSQLVQTADGQAVANVRGFVQVLQLTPLDGGSVRVWFRYYTSATGEQPTSFEIRDTADPQTITTVSVATKSDHDYEIELAGLLDATDYTFAIVALTDSAESELTTFDVTGDNAGPDIDLTLTAEVW